MPRAVTFVEPLGMAWGRMARALGAAGRMLWWRKDLQDGDDVVLDLVAKALARLRPSLRPAAQSGLVVVLRLAPDRVRAPHGGCMAPDFA